MTEHHEPNSNTDPDNGPIEQHLPSNIEAHPHDSPGTDARPIASSEAEDASPAAPAAIPEHFADPAQGPADQAPISSSESQVPSDDEEEAPAEKQARGDNPFGTYGYPRNWVTPKRSSERSSRTLSRCRWVEHRPFQSRHISTHVLVNAIYRDTFGRKPLPRSEEYFPLLQNRLLCSCKGGEYKLSFKQTDGTGAFTPVFICDEPNCGFEAPAVPLEQAFLQALREDLGTPQAFNRRKEAEDLLAYATELSSKDPVLPRSHGDRQLIIRIRDAISFFDLDPCRGGKPRVRVVYQDDMGHVGGDGPDWQVTDLVVDGNSCVPPPKAPHGARSRRRTGGGFSIFRAATPPAGIAQVMSGLLERFGLGAAAGSSTSKS